VLKNKLVIIVALIIVSPFVIGGFRLNTIIYPALLFGVPYTFRSVFWRKKPLIADILLILALTFYSFATLFMAMRFVLCGYGPKTYRYVHKTIPDLRIIGRDFSCLGTRADLVLYKEFSLNPQVKLEFYYKTLFEYNWEPIDTTVWKSVGFIEY